MWNDFPSFPTCIFYICCLFTPGKQPYILRSVRWPLTEPLTVTHARDHWWTLDFANAFVSPGVNSRAELVPSPYARNGAPRRWLGDYSTKTTHEQFFKNIFTWKWYLQKYGNYVQQLRTLIITFPNINMIECLNSQLTRTKQDNTWRHF
jgi:hypothetical protein